MRAKQFWNFLTGDLVHEIDWSLNTAVLGSKHHRPSDLLALSGSDLAIRIVDVETRKLVRELWGCNGKINDFVSGLGPLAYLLFAVNKMSIVFLERWSLDHCSIDGAGHSRVGSANRSSHRRHSPEE